MQNKMKICFLGCGVIGSLYAALFAKAGISVELYARGTRKKVLEENGLVIERKNKICQFTLPVVDNLKKNYDFIFVAVRREQIEEALQTLKDCPCKNIVTMVNTAESYEKWEKILGKGRLIPAFPGAGGEMKGKVVKASLTPALIQKTSFGEISGKMTKRVKQLESLFRKAKVPYEICPSMEEWQLCHLALVVPLGDAIREGKGNHLDAAGNQQLMKKTARRIKRNLYLLQKKGVRIIPKKLRCLSYLPDSICTFALTKLFCSKIGEIYIYPHAHHAEQEMLYLHKTFYLHMRKL